MVGQLTRRPEVERDTAARVTGKLSTLDRHRVDRPPLLEPQVDQLHGKTLFGVKCLNGIQSEQARHGGERRVGDGRVGEDEATSSVQGNRDVVRDRTNDAALREHVLPSLRITGMLLIHHVRLEQHRLAWIHQTAKGIPVRTSEPCGIEPRDSEAFAHGVVDGVWLTPDRIEAVFGMAYTGMKRTLARV